MCIPVLRVLENSRSGTIDRKAIFDTFIMQYAAAEDNIRVLWEQLLKAHEKFSVSGTSATICVQHVRTLHLLRNRGHQASSDKLFVFA